MIGVPLFILAFFCSIIGVGTLNDNWITPRLEQWFGETIGNDVGNLFGFLGVCLFWLLIAICIRPAAGVRAIGRIFRDKEQRVFVLIVLVLFVLVLGLVAHTAGVNKQAAAYRQCLARHSGWYCAVDMMAGQADDDGD